MLIILIIYLTLDPLSINILSIRCSRDTVLLLGRSMRLGLQLHCNSDEPKIGCLDSQEIQDLWLV